MADNVLDNSFQHESTKIDYSKPDDEGCFRVKVICLGDSAVGKSKLVERFLMDGYKKNQLSTYALNMFRYKMTVDGEDVVADVWDTAGQERFKNLHPSYYHQAHSCIMVFDTTRKVTYKNLTGWYKELRDYRPEIPCLCAANKIDVDYEVTRRTFQLPTRYGMPLYFVSASNGTNVVKLFKDAIIKAVEYKKNPTDFVDQVYQELEAFDFEGDFDKPGKGENNISEVECSVPEDKHSVSEGDDCVPESNVPEGEILFINAE